MSYTDEIFERVSIKGIVDSLLYNYDSVERDERDYEQRMKDAYHKFEEKAKKFEEGYPPVLPDYANELVSDAQEIYMEIGLQSGILLALDVLKNINFNKKCWDEEKDIDYKEMYNILFSDITLALKVLYDKKGDYIEKAETILKATQCKTESMFMDSVK